VKVTIEAATMQKSMQKVDKIKDRLKNLKENLLKVIIVDSFVMLIRFN
jgi:hypothetical protein